MSPDAQIENASVLSTRKQLSIPELKIAWGDFHDDRFLREKLVSAYDAAFYGVYHGQRTHLRDKINRKVEFMKLPKWLKWCIRTAVGLGVKAYNLLFYPFRKVLFKMMLMDRILIDQMVDTYKKVIDSSRKQSDLLAHRAAILERDVHYLSASPISGQPYLEFEELYRGNTASVEQKMGVYVSYLKSQRDWTSQNIVLDVGCGRGEFLKLSKQILNCQVQGVDINPYLEPIFKKLSLPFQCQDAFLFLEHIRERFDVVACFHLIEHLPKVRLPFFLQYCVKALKPGGYLVLEWPNVTTLSVSGDTFELDPTHVARPHPLYIRALLNWYGMEVQQDLDLSPHEAFKQWENEPKDSREYQLAYKIFGSQDKGFIAKKVDSKRL